MFLTEDPKDRFWISPLDGDQRPVDPALLRAAKEVWPRAFELVRNGLHDEPRTAELLEHVVHRIAEAQRSGKLPSELNPVQPLLLARFHQRLINQIRRERRIAYVGTVLELDNLHAAPAATQDLHTLLRSILIAEILALVDQHSRRLMVLRLLDHKWSAIGRLVGAKTGTVRERYRVALNRLRERLSGAFVLEEGESL
ncbi:MAG: hypothetical protein L0338_38340 [Acidobacteria bacterium]|nr:hypothetical protein [Acidobacteriota bacterium]